MNLDLRGKNALVRGASQGIGRAIAIELAELGANITLVSRNAANLETVQTELKQENGQRHSFFALDFSDWLQVQKQIPEILKLNSNYQILVNNSGGPAPGLALEARPEDFSAALSSHLLSNQVFVQALLPGMKASHYGRIINIISTSVKEPILGLGVSNATRAAVAAWAKTLSKELGPFGITVNNVLPGATRTERLKNIFEGRSKKSGKTVQLLTSEAQAEIALGRFAEPNEIASAVGFLASPAASYITGINLPVEGGRLASL